MKICILGAGAMRTPLLLHGLLHSDLPIHEVDLFDIDGDRLAQLFPVMEAVTAGKAVTLRRAGTSADAIRGCDFVLVSIRVGGMAQRAHDETVALGHGILGQETVGPAGFAKGMRTIPPLLDYAREVERLAPQAFFINFSNPVGMVTQAVASETGARIVGICDTPTELFEEVARALGVPSRECFFDFVGLNHLGWLRQVFHRAEPQMQRLLEGNERLYRAPFFPPESLRELGLLPTEYVFFYYHPKRALEGIRAKGQSRGQQLEELNAGMFAQLRAGEAPLPVYEHYLSTRNSTYMQSESGGTPHCGQHGSILGEELTGYDKIALSVLRGIHFNLGTLIPLNVSNRGNVPELEPRDVVEVPSVVDRNGVHALHVGALPPQVRELVLQVKEYERLTVRAALSRRFEDAVAALARNPLVPDRATAEALVRELRVV